ncbi:NUDIX hydrolase [Aquimarina algiphila]|uniref:NUDIX hydrolase n=1 Tax=Aquimarina algiphila TaxID=2047982 RepID=A0A554VEE8_9FLAO|nr:NUDIX hydrolase [Aquimarina algiphila]TSE05368.1 NUDIX hydrolase [Aquimarina algiphila]
MRIKKHKEKSRLIIYQGDKLLVLQKHTSKLEYGLIGGVLEQGESPEYALIREAFEEVTLKITEQDLEYQCSITIELKNKHKLSKHYFLCSDYTKPFLLAEPHKFRKIEWVYWKDAIKFLGKSNKKVVKSLFKPCKLNY